METPVVGEGWTEWTWLERVLHERQVQLINRRHHLRSIWMLDEEVELNDSIEGLMILRDTGF